MFCACIKFCSLTCLSSVQDAMHAYVLCTLVFFRCFISEYWMCSQFLWKKCSNIKCCLQTLAISHIIYKYVYQAFWNPTKFIFIIEFASIRLSFRLSTTSFLLILLNLSNYGRPFIMCLCSHIFLAKRNTSEH